MSDEKFYDHYAPDMPNIEKAMGWAFGPDGDIELGIAITAYSWAAWAALSYFGRFLPWADLALQHCGAQTPEAVATELKRSAVSAYAVLKFQEAVRLADSILPGMRAKGDPLTFDVLRNASQALRLLGRHVEAGRYIEEAARLAATSPPNRVTLGVQWALAAQQGFDNPDAALETLRQMQQVARGIGADGWATLAALDRVALFDHADADALIAETRRELDAIRPKHMFGRTSAAGLSLILAGQLARRGTSSDLDEAWTLARGTEKLTGRFIQTRWTPTFVQLAIADGRPADGARLLGAAFAANARTGVNFWGTQRGEVHMRALLNAHLAEPELIRLIEEGKRLSPDELFDLAMTRKGDGR